MRFTLHSVDKFTGKMVPTWLADRAQRLPKMHRVLSLIAKILCCVVWSSSLCSTAYAVSAASGPKLGQSEAATPVWLIVPFGLLLLMIATGPLLYPAIWHRYYPVVSISLATGVMSYYVWHGRVDPAKHAVIEYVQFMALISALYIASGGILIRVNCSVSPMVNLVVLWAGAILANFIGTTGASMLLIRPYLRLNGRYVRAYHVAFFIFMVSNVGGALTPIGDPPLFLGFLKGVPFFWTLRHNFLPWLMALCLLSLMFYLLEWYNQDFSKKLGTGFKQRNQAPITFRGKYNSFWLACIVGAVFLDPHIVPGMPPFVRELLLLGIALLSYRYADNKALRENGFDFGPLREVAFLFIGIFGTMVPALAYINYYARSGATWLVEPSFLYWGTGCMSSMLDNAPTYVSFLAGSMAAQSTPIGIADYAEHPVTALQLKAIAVASVFFGAMTYIGNGPNFMVRSIAEEQGVPMPSFLGYLWCFALPFLMPVLVLVWLVCFYMT